MNFASVRPGIDLFNANVARGDAQRSQEEHDFERRAQMEQAQGADRGLRNAIAAYYAQKQAPVVAPVPTTAFQPTPAVVPNPAATTPVVSPDQSMNPADNPDYGGPARAAPMPNAVPRSGVDVPATVAAPPAPPAPAAAAAPAPAQPAPGARPGGSFAPMMGELAKQPGTGQAMMHLFSTDLTSQRAAAVENRKLQAEGNKEMLAHLKDGNVQMAQAVAKQYGIQIPDEVWKNRGLVMQLRLGANLAKTMGVKDDHAVHFVQGFVEGTSAGLPEDQAVMKGLQNVPKAGFELKGVVTDENNQVQGYDKSGNVKPLGVKARPQKWQVTGGEGRATATVQNRDDMAKRLKVAYPGLDDSIVQRLVVNPRAQITAQDIMRTEASMRKLTNMGRPVYKTDAEAHTAAVAAVRAAQKDAGVLIGGEGAPAAPASAPGPADAGPAGRVPPPVRMRFDSQGNEIAQ